ncbi:MAG: hypothetical protein WDO18_09780 [Acidobacteriota bacterium]
MATAAYRIGFGEVTTDFEILANARWRFMAVAEMLYPQIREDLIVLSQQFTDYEFGFEPELAAEGSIGRWCQKWNLVSGRMHAPAEWALRTAYETLSWYSDSVRLSRPVFFWVVACGGAVPNRPEGATTSLRLSSLKRLKARTSKRSQLSRELGALLDAGYRKAPTLRNLEHVYWTVEQAVDRLTYRQIAEKYFNNPLDPDEVGRNIRDQVSGYRSLMGWPAVAGRHAR